MKISLRNFGPLKEFDFGLDADFTLIVGENNIGKSYAISMMYALLKTLLTNDLIGRPYFGEFFYERVSERSEFSGREEFLKQYKTTTVRDIDISHYVSHFAKSIASSVFVDQLEKTIQGTFGDISNLENRRNSAPTQITLSTEILDLTIKIEKSRLVLDKLSIRSRVIYRKSKQQRTPKRSQEEVIIYGPGSDHEAAEIRIFYEAFDAFREFVLEAISLVSDIHYLPASRSGLYQALSAFGQIIAELSKRRTFLSQRIELPAISEPLIDYFLKLNEIRPSKKYADGVFSAIADDLEKNVLGGSVEFDNKSKRLFYKPFDVDLKLDLSSTSSMVSEVAPIVTYLKHVLPESEQKKLPRGLNRHRLQDGVKRKQIIFVEEPEAHLHPQSQLLLLDAFSKLVREAGVKLILTSHSNFVFNKVSNLIMAGGFKGANVEAFRFARGVYGTTGERLEVDRFGVSDENFVQVSEDLFMEKMDLINEVGQYDA